MVDVQWGEPSSGPSGMAEKVEHMVRNYPMLFELRSVGIALEVTGDETGVVLRTDPRGRGQWPRLEARLVGERWWMPEGTTHAERLANHLAADLRRKWDLWVAGA